MATEHECVYCGADISNVISHICAATKAKSIEGTSQLTGVKFDQQKPDLSLIPVVATLEEGYVWTAGKLKYSAYNWADGIVYSRILAAMSRHMELLKAGIMLDKETKRHHAAAVRCGAAMLIHFDFAGRTDLDDRMPLTKELKDKIEAMAGGEYIWDLLK